VVLPAQTAPPCPAGQWLAQYYPNTSLSGTPVLERCESATPNYDWGSGTPVAGLPVDSFSARWTGSPVLNGGNTTFSTDSDDGVRLYVDGTRIINNWTFHAMTTNSVSRTLAAGTHAVTLEYFEGGGGAIIKLGWTQSGTPPPLPTVTLAANPPAVNYGGSSVLSWQSQNAKSCTASGAWSGSKATSGTQTVTPSATSQYVLTCRNAAGQSVAAQASIAVNGAPPPPSFVSFTATPAAITAGNSSALAWQTQKAASCTASGAWSGAKAIAGTQTVSPAATSTYTLTCKNSTGQTSSQSATVTVAPPPVITSFTASPAGIASGGSSTLAWQSHNAASCAASGAWSGTKAASGSAVVQPQATSVYVLTCSGNGAVSTPANVTVTVRQPQPLPTVTGLTAITASGPKINLTWNDAARTGKWVTGYYAGYFWDWTGSDPAAALDAVDMTTMTHFVFARYAPGGGTLGGTPGQIVEGAGTGHRFVEDALIAKGHAQGVKALLMIGGAGDGPGFDASTMNSSVRSLFIQNLLARVVAKNYDGVDVDWEENLGNATQQAQVLALLQELRAAAWNLPRFQPPNAPFVLTFPAFWTTINYPTVTPWHVQVASLVDQYNLMTYSMADTWPGWKSWHHSPLSGAQPSHPTAIDASIQEYVNAGVPRAKLGIGIGLYGIYYAPGVTAPRQDVGVSRAQSSDWENNYRRLHDDGAFAQPSAMYQWDEVAKQSYITYSPAWNRWGVQPISYLTYEDERSIRAKGEWVRQNQVGGTIVWTINYGHIPSQGNLLMAAVRDGFLGNSAVTSYRIYRDGLLWGTVAGTAYQDTLVSSGATYTYTVAAIDVLGNQGPASAPVTVMAQ
jgi:GH18 family chitinase